MQEHEKKEKGRKKVNEIKTFPIPFSLEKNQEDLIINTDTTSKSTRKSIINKGINFHNQGKIKEATKYYQYCINNEFNDYKVFSNYGVILVSQGKLKEAELCIRKAIEINPNCADSYSNLAKIFGQSLVENVSTGNLNMDEVMIQTERTNKLIEIFIMYVDELFHK